MGNICRSPLAEGIARKILPKEKYEKIDSAGIGSWQEGQPPDENMQLVAKEGGYDISDLRARQITEQDFFDFDLILGMDSKVMEALTRLQHEFGGKAQVRKFLKQDVPDPYLGGLKGFFRVFDMVNEGISKLQ
jgi:protein-tyrosine phosphatase